MPGISRQQTIYLERFDFGSMVKWFNQLFDEEIAYQPISQPSESANHPLALKRVLCPAVANQQCFYNQWISRAISFVYSLLFTLKSTLAKDVHAVFHKWYCWLPKYFPYYLSLGHCDRFIFLNFAVSVLWFQQVSGYWINKKFICSTVLHTFFVLSASQLTASFPFSMRTSSRL